MGTFHALKVLFFDKKVLFFDKKGLFFYKKGFLCNPKWGLFMRKKYFSLTRKDFSFTKRIFFSQKELFFTKRIFLTSSTWKRWQKTCQAFAAILLNVQKNFYITRYFTLKRQVKIRSKNLQNCDNLVNV